MNFDENIIIIGSTGDHFCTGLIREAQKKELKASIQLMIDQRPDFLATDKSFNIPFGF
jgi:formyltetrahydrofolate hydrolase